MKGIGDDNNFEKFSQIFQNTQTMKLLLLLIYFQYGMHTTVLDSGSNWDLEVLEENQRRKILGARTRTNKELNPHCWEASPLTTAQSLLP